MPKSSQIDSKTRGITVPVVKVTEDQCSVLNQAFGAKRFVYNHFLAQYKEYLDLNEGKIKHYKSILTKRKLSSDEKKDRASCYLSYNYQQNQLPLLKKQEETAWLRELPSQTAQAYIRDLHDGIDRWRKKQNQFPVMKKRRSCRLSARFISSKQFNIQRLSKKRYSLELPKIGKIHFKCHMTVLIKKNIKINEVTAFYDRGKQQYFLSINYTNVLKKPIIINKVPKYTVHPVGIDRGIAVSAFLSTGEQKNLSSIKNIQAKKKRYQKKLAKQFIHLKQRKKLVPKDPYSVSKKNIIKTIVAINKCSNKETNIRKDFLHKLSYDIVKNHDHVSIEALEVKNMSKSAKGTIENPGTNVKAKTGLNREIINQGWGKFRDYLKYKCHENNVTFVEVDPKYTSTTCIACGKSHKESRKGQQFSCLFCGFVSHADFVGSVNIMARGLRASGFGETCISRFVEEATIHYGDKSVSVVEAPTITY